MMHSRGRGWSPSASGLEIADASLSRSAWRGRARSGSRRRSRERLEYLNLVVGHVVVSEDGDGD